MPLRRAALAALLALLALACGRGDHAPREGAAASSPESPRREASPDDERGARASLLELQAGLDRCGALLEHLSPTSTPTFSALMQACSGLFARRACRDELARGEFSRPRVHEVCSAAYCDTLSGRRPSFCTRELPTDADFLLQFGDFTDAVLRRDLREALGEEGAEEIARLLGQLIRDQAGR